jgi:parallel beta-helix repeat (two copies)
MSYNPSLHTVTNKALGIAQANPTDARSYFYDEALFKYRPYNSTAEVLTYLDKPDYRTGHVSAFIEEGGVINEYWFKDGTGDNDLVLKNIGSVIAGTDTRLLSGGGVSYSGTGLIYDITAATYLINGIYGSSAAGQVTLSPGNATFDRYDIIGVNNTDNYFVVEGTPSANPEIPFDLIDADTQLVLSVINVKTGATVPPPGNIEIVYDENTEAWSHTASGITVNFDNTVNVYRGTKSIDAGAWTNGQYFRSLLTGSTKPVSNYSIINLRVKLKAAMVTNSNITINFRKAGINVATKGYALNNSVGFTRTNINTWQNIVIPLSVWPWLSADFDEIRITFSGTGSGAWFDYITLQGGTPPPAGETDPIALSKSITINAGTNITIAEPKTQLLSVNPEWTINAAAGGGTPSGSAGGDLSGTYPNPAVKWASGYATYDARYLTGGGGDIVNAVTDYGADNTGATDATAAINAAIANDGTKNKIYLPAGTYKVTTSVLKASSQTNKRGIELRNDIEIFGDGIGNTIITTFNNLTGTLADTNWYPIFNGHSATVVNTSIHDLEISGNQSNQNIYNPDPYSNPTGHADLTSHQSIQGIYYYLGDNNKVYNVYAYACQGFGIEFNNSTRASTSYCKFDTNGNGGIGYSNSLTTGTIEHCLVTNNNSDNIRLYGGNGVCVRHNELSYAKTNATSPNWFAGIYVFNSKNAIVENNIIHNNSAYGIDVATDDAATYTGIIIRGNIVYQNGNGGIAISFTKAIVSGNQIFKNGKKSDGATDTRSNYNPAAISANACSDVVIADNIAWEDSQNIQIWFLKKWGGGAAYGIQNSTVHNNRIKWMADIAHAYKDADGGNTSVIGNMISNSAGTIIAGNSYLPQDYVAIGTASIDATALLTLESVTKGILFPRMTNAQRDAIATPSEGLTIYSLTDHAIVYYNGAAWVSPSGGGGGTGITTLNTLTALTQTFATGVTGTDFGIVSGGSVHTFNLPDASATARGLVNIGAQTFIGVKSFSSQASFPAGLDVGNTFQIKLGGNNFVRRGSSTGVIFQPAAATAFIFRNAADNTDWFTIKDAGGIVFGTNASWPAAFISSNTTLNINQRVILASAPSANITITLPAISSANAGIMYTLKRIDATANTITIARTGSDTIDGATSYSLATQYKYITIYAVLSGTIWVIIASN